MNLSRIPYPIKLQRGAVFIVMLVILVLGVAATLIFSLSAAGIKNERDIKTADALALAKEALIGYALKDTNRPGELPCPDYNDDGMLTIGVDILGGAGSPCASLIGRLPWKTLDLPDLRDSSGEHLWYAVTDTFHAGDTTPINSDTSGAITVTGSVNANNVIAIVFAPGSPLSGQVRPAANSLGWAQYLEDVTSATTIQLSTPDDHPGGNYTYNDHALLITYENLMPLVEKRIAREVRNCLDDYAASNTNHRYPWAAPVTDATAYPNRPGAYNVFFGRVSEIPNTSTSSPSPPPTGTLLTYIQAVQTALNNYIANQTAGKLVALNNAGETLKEYTGSGSTPATIQAGQTAEDCPGLSCASTLQGEINTAMGWGAQDATMSTIWPVSCTTFSSSYWKYWRDLVFYQLADGYQPKSGASGTFTPLHINGSGNYQAAVLVARVAFLPGQVRPSLANPPDNYLEVSAAGISNSHQSVVGATPSVNFVTYKPTDTVNYSDVNDLVLSVP